MDSPDIQVKIALSGENCKIQSGLSNGPLVTIFAEQVTIFIVEKKTRDANTTTKRTF